MIELNWEAAHAWETLANQGKSEFFEPHWKFDCGFKLDCDGPLLSVSSRFYPPYKNDHDGWEGSVSLFVLGNEVKGHRKEFKSDSLGALKVEVEKHVGEYEKKLIEFLKVTAADAL